MSLPHFFLEDQVLADETQERFLLQLNADDMKHARVLRLSPGQHIAVIDASQDYFECVIESDADGLEVSIAGHEDAGRSLPRVTLIQGLAKGEKMDSVIRHATEVGVTTFIPFACTRSVVKLDGKKAAARVSRWQTIARSAAMQSGQRTIPQVMDVANLSQAIDAVLDATTVLVCWEESRGLGMHDALQKALTQSGAVPSEITVAIVIGPEGGLTSEEVEAFETGCPSCSVISLGSSILRTETAGIIAPALALYELGGLQ